jgi:hypothetical protein
MNSLQSLGFGQPFYCSESLGPYSVVKQFPVFLLAFLKLEVLHLPRPLRLATANVIHAHTDPSALALCMGLGVKFYSVFIEGTLIISSNFQSDVVPKVSSKITRLPPGKTLEATWVAHTDRVFQLISEGLQSVDNLSFPDYVKICSLEEDLSQYDLSWT